jgi:ABC-type transport system substrate-binding protein
MQMASYSNRRFDVLLDSIASVRDSTTQRALWSRTQHMLRDEQPWTVLWFAPDIFVARESVQNIDADIRGLLVNVTKWSLK